MSTDNISRDEARTRGRLLSVHETTASLDLTAASATFRSRSVVRFGCLEPGADTFLNLTAPRVHSVHLNGEPLDPAAVFDGNRIRLERLAADNEVTVVADCSYMSTGEGLHRFVDPVDEATYLYTQFETFDAHRMYACFDQPDLKTVFRLDVTAPAAWQVVSNMPVAATETLDDAAVRTSFEASPRMSTYVTALVAGPYHHVHRRHRDIELGLYCRASLAEHLDADELFAVTAAGLDFFQDMFDLPYPFGAKYDQLFVPEFNAGAMENPGCVTFLEDYVFRSKVTKAAYERRAETVLHEMAHMWFGDLVTMRWWDDLWLNESFASYVSVVALVAATEFTTGWTTFANVEKTWAYRQDQLSSTHPIAADIPDNEAVKLNFDGITYAKGASVLKQLVAWVGQDEFRSGVRGYFRRHAWGNTTLQDLLDVLEETSGRELSGWSKQWLQTAGVNTLRATFTLGDDGRYGSFAIEQEAPEDHPTLRSHRLAVGLYDREGSQLVRRDRVELDVVGPSTDVPELRGVSAAPLVLVNDEDLTYAKIRLDERSLATVRDGIGELTDPLARALCWAACWDMTRDAEMAARDYLRLVLGGVGQESDVGVVQSLLRQARGALDLYADPAFRPTGVARLAEAAERHLAAAEPGSDHQLAWARAFAASATAPAQVQKLVELLAGSAAVPGLTMDAELRWVLVQRLAAVGALDEAGIAAELERDDTAAGRRHAASARAARPTAAAKEEAWASVVDRDDLPNAMQAAVLAGFAQPDQLELLAGYTERYFAMVGPMWEQRTPETAHTVAAGLFPHLQISPHTVARLDRYLVEAQPPPSLHRLLSEGRDGLLRALRARERDRQAGAAGDAAR